MGWHKWIKKCCKSIWGLIKKEERGIFLFNQKNKNNIHWVTVKMFSKMYKRIKHAFL